MALEQHEFTFPDDESTGSAGATPEPEAVEVQFEVVDDTPAKDRNRKPMKEAPGEVTDEELSEYSDKVQSRLKHFSRGYHDERRAKEAAVREREEAVRLAQAVVVENNQLQTQLKARVAEEAKLAHVDAQKKVKAAYEAGDADELVVANEALARAVVKADHIEREAAYAEKALQQRPPVVASNPQTTQPAVDPQASQWQKDNEWFGQDEEMTSFALGLHQKLLKQGVNPRSDDYYEKINTRMRQVFPDQFSDETEVELEPKSEAKPRKPSVVAAATRSTAPRKVVLTASQVSIAKRLGVPLELYAKKVAEEMRK